MKSSRKWKLGPVVEVFVYKALVSRGKRGGKRQLVANVLPGLETQAAYAYGAGIYRFEYRDARRWVVAVKRFVLMPNGVCALAPRQQRAPGPRKVPPPWDGR